MPDSTHGVGEVVLWMERNPLPVVLLLLALLLGALEAST